MSTLQVNTSRRPQLKTATIIGQGCLGTWQVCRSPMKTDANFISETDSDWIRQRFIMSGRLSPKFYLRGNVDYEVDPNPEVRGMGAALDYRVTKQSHIEDERFQKYARHKKTIL